MTTPIALIVDDEPDIRELLQLTLGRMDIESCAAENLTQARLLLKDRHFNLCLSDMRLPDGNGINLVEYMRDNYPNIPIAMITAHGNMESAIQALKAGAFDFVSKPVDLHVLRNLVTTALKVADTQTEDTVPDDLTLLGDSTAIRNIQKKIAKLARSQAPIYISGESGTGKELVARMIHEQGPRSDKPFVPVNCGAIPESLMENEFFGHTKGSFTGATSDKDGLFQAANGGTLFLDEVADLPLQMQVKLLRAIQEKSVRPVGASRETPVDVRILSATHKDLATLVEDGVFRQDLYYRINVIQLQLPNLRERMEDIPVLAEHVLSRLASENGINTPKLSDQAVKALKSHPFPGNVRELENVLERAITLCEGNTVQASDLHLPTTTTSPTSSKAEDGALEPYLDAVEKEAIVKALEQTRYNKTAAAKLLGISFRALRYRLKKLDLE